MVKHCSSLQDLQRSQFKRGDWVRYCGGDPRIQQDYGNQDLRIVAIAPLSNLAVCDNQFGQRLVGVSLSELNLADCVISDTHCVSHLAS